VIADVMIEGLPVKVISSGKSYKVFEQYRGKVILLSIVPKGAAGGDEFGESG
jgi:hypothetical protein